MDAHRLDLGPNRWLAAGGLAFIHVRVWKGWMAQISVAPVRDVVIGRATLFSLPHRPVTNWCLGAIVFFGVLVFPELLFWLFRGSDSPQDWVSGIISIAVVAAILSVRIWRRGKLGIFLSADQFDYPDRVYFSETQARDPEILAYCDYLKALKAEAGDGKRKARTYILFPWWMSIAFAVIFMLMVGFAVRYGLAMNGVNHPEIYGTVAAVVFSGTILLFSSERSLLFNSDLRRAHSYLLTGDAGTAVNILQPILDAKPQHRYANYLMTIARLMQGDVERAEDIVIQVYHPRPNLPSRYHRIMDYKLWESRHGDH